MGRELNKLFSPWAGDYGESENESHPVVSDSVTPWTVHGILQARILEWVALPFSRGSSQPRDRIQVSCIAGEPQGKPLWLWRTSLIKGQSLRSVTGTQMLIMTMQLLSLSVMSDSLWSHGLQPTRLLWSWDSSGKNTGVGCHFLLQGILPTQGLNSGLRHCRWILYRLSHQGSPIMTLNSPNFCMRKMGIIVSHLIQGVFERLHYTRKIFCGWKEEH